ncbi:unnamed protein product [Pleuronectes platessa]|uniref:Uncharacterized protein n=1 Tax=Pleuronectes platessa TaxID=8262 RepID=A0A9N7VZK9_PLEPL|nr:unnamed protein product [Pleuronectes platessa]
MPAAGELRCVDAAIESVLEDIDSAFILKEEHRTWRLRQSTALIPIAPALWLFTTDTEATLNRRAALIISPVHPVDRCTALCRSHRRLKHRAAPRLPRGASASGVTGTKF